MIFLVLDLVLDFSIKTLKILTQKKYFVRTL